MNCTRCGRALDAQATELGACRYCGQAISAASATVPGIAPAAPANQPIIPNPPTQSRYGWEDWPATNQPRPDAASGAGNTSPTLPRLDQSPANAANNTWSDPSSSSNASTQFGPLSFAAPAPLPPDAAAAGMAPFAPHAPAPGAGLPPQNVSPPFAAAPAQRPPAAPTSPRRGKTLALAIVAAALLIAVIGGGLLLARSFNSSPAASAPGVTASSPSATQPATATPAPPSPTATPSPTPIPTSAYRDPAGLFSLQYPTAWAHMNFAPTAANLPLPLNGVRFSSGAAEFVILTGQELPGLSTAGLTEQVDDALLHTMNAQHISSASPATIGGKTWTEKSADTDGGKHTVIASISFNSHLYTLWYSAPAGAFAADETQFFNPMIASFMFGV